MRPLFSKCDPCNSNSASSENLLEIQVLRPTQHLLNHKVWRWGRQSMLLQSLSVIAGRALTFENPL